MFNEITEIFRKGSKTYFYSSLFFPNKIKEDVSKLYSFVRKADDYVDTIPQKTREFYKFKEDYHNTLQGEKSGDIVIDYFVDLINRKNIEKRWVDSFLMSMEKDIDVRYYKDIEKLKTYLFGSAEVIGLMMAKIMDLPKESYECAKHLGRAMQYINFIRDIKEDMALGRTYLPQEIMESVGLKNLTYEHVLSHPGHYSQFIRGEIERYRHWQQESEKGYHYIRKRYLIPIKTASDMYKWTAYQIYKKPFIVYEKKVKPPLYQILTGIIASTLGKYNMRPCTNKRDPDV